MSRPEMDTSGSRDSPQSLLLAPQGTTVSLEERPRSGGGVGVLTDVLAAAKASIADPNPAEQAILAKLDEALARTEEGRLRVAMLGQFKRGKSTLLNALLGVPLLPTGITPVTAIPTYVRVESEPSLRIEFEGSRKPLESLNASEFPAIIARYVSESTNANNREQVRGVEIALNSATFSDRVVLVDTPGVGSTFLHNSRAAEAVLSDCDVGIFVLSPDPPITEVELGYLDDVRRVVPKLYFALNKVDLLSPDDRDVALSFLANVLEDKLGPGESPRIFPVSAKAALLAKREGDSAALAASGVLELEQALASELASEERAIAFATGRSRAISLVGQLLYRRQLEHKALLTPEQDLIRKIGEFEHGISRFESERANLSDLMAVDRRRLLADMTALTDRIWEQARSKFAKLAKDETPSGFDEVNAREQLGKALERHFETAAHEATEQARGDLISRLAKHEAQASVLLAQVRRAAADLMDMSVSLPPAEHAFELAREAYWVAACAGEFDHRRLRPRAHSPHAARLARKASAPPDRLRHGQSGIAQRGEPRLGASTEHRGRIPPLRVVARRATLRGDRRNPAGHADRARKALREIGGSRYACRAGGAIDRRAVRRARRPRKRQVQLAAPTTARRALKLKPSSRAPETFPSRRLCEA